MKRSGILLCAVLAVAETALAAPKPLAESFTDAFKETLPLAFHALPGHYMAVLWREGETLHTIEGNFNSSICRSSQTYSLKGGRFHGGKGFLNGWHYVDRELYAGKNPEKPKGRTKSK